MAGVKKLQPEELQDLLANLNERQQAFCREYLIDFNGTQAAIRAGYKETSAAAQASDLLNYANIQTYLSHLKVDICEAAGVTAIDVLKEYKKIGFANIKDFLDKGNKIKDLSDLPRDLTAAVASVSTTENSVEGGFKSVTVRFKMNDKLRALDKLAEYLNILEGEKNTVNNTSVWVVQRPSK